MIWPLARRLLSKAAALLILLGVGAGAGLLLSPGVSAQRLPYGDTSLGRVATQTVRARRDYDILDEEATRKRREDAQADVRPVYDYDSRGLAEVHTRIAESFAGLREELARARRTDQGREHNVVSRLSPADLESMRQELMGRLQALVDPRDFRRLAEEGFSPLAERQLADLVTGQMQHLILEDRTLLPGERARGIYVRALPEGNLGSEVVQDLAPPAGLLAGIIRQPFILFYHFFAVAFVSIWIVMQDTIGGLLGLWKFPVAIEQSMLVFWKACVVIFPFIFSEMRS